MPDRPTPLFSHSELAAAFALLMPSGPAEQLADRWFTEFASDRTDHNGWYRSEERRVGKECRSRWWPDQKKKKNRDSNDREQETESKARCEQGFRELHVI